MIGAILLVGAIGLFDLRLLGWGRGLDIGVLRRATLPIAITGLGVMVLSGSVLFAADAEALARSWLFRLKLLFIALAGFNALAFHQLARARAGHPALKAIAVLSLGFWLAVVICGRMIAYL